MISTDFNGYGFTGMYFMLAQVAFIENIQVVVHWLVVCTFTHFNKYTFNNTAAAYFTGYS